MSALAILCRKADLDDSGESSEGYKLGPWQPVPSAPDMTAAAVSFIRELRKAKGADPVAVPLPGMGDIVDNDDPPTFVVIVRGTSREAVFVGDGVRDDGAREAHGFDRGGDLLCKKPCGECSEDHHFVEVYAEDHHSNSTHEANGRGVEVWIPCKHCDAWIEYDFGEGIGDAITDALFAITEEP